jgi:hypothetical protein
MTEHLYSVLDELVPRFDNEPGDWNRVIADARAGEPVRTSARPLDMTPEKPRSRRWLTRRRIAVIAIAVVAIVTPLIAAASQDWWFLRFASAPEPITDVKVVKTGEWDGKPWQLVAYRSAGNLVCYGVMPRSTSGTTGYGEGGALACIRIAGVPRESDSEEARLGVTYHSGPSPALPAYVAGPIVDSADEVEIHLVGGEVIRTPTFDAPDELGSIRFYAAQLPETDSSGGRSGVEVQKLVGIDHDGEVVACRALPFPTGTPLSACR